MAGAAEVGEVILYTHKLSYYGERVDLALTEKGIPFTRVPVDFAKKPKGLLEANPLYGKIPSLVHNGDPILESLIILEYLEDVWPDRVPLMPKSPVDRSKVRFWSDYITKGFVDMPRVASTKEGSPERQAALANLPHFFKTLNAAMIEYSAEGPFFTGAQFGYLDVVLGPWVCYKSVVEEVLKCKTGTPEELPRLFKWLEAMKERKSVQEVLPDDDEICDYMIRRLKQAAENLEAAEAKIK